VWDNVCRPTVARLVMAEHWLSEREEKRKKPQNALWPKV